MLDCRFEGCDFAGARFRDLSLIRVEFADCRLTGADLSGASLRDVRFVRCKLDDANFRFVNGEGAVVFEECVLTEADLHGAVWAAAFPGCDVREIVGLDGLRGATLTRAQAIDLGVRLAIEAGIDVIDQ